MEMRLARYKGIDNKQSSTASKAFSHCSVGKREMLMSFSVVEVTLTIFTHLRDYQWTVQRE